MRLGVTHCRPSEKKFNTNISKKAELVGASDYGTYNLWCVMFMHHQRYLNKSNKFFQDNQSATKIEVNGRNYFTGNLRHIDTRYFFINDKVEKVELSIVYCPTHLILYDYFIKTLYGALFHNFRDTIMERFCLFTLKRNLFIYKKGAFWKNIPSK